MLEIHCSGTPHEAPRAQVLGSLAFYRQLFQETCGLDWTAVQAEAERYVAPLTRLAPRHLDEIRGIAEGSGVDFLDILALNVRTEITFGLFTDAASSTNGGRRRQSDGCTSLSWFSPDQKEDESTSSPKRSFSYLAQNWDWMPAQRANIIILYIDHPSSSHPPSSNSDPHPLPQIATVTEAGLLAKTGLNSHGVGVCLNALRCRGVDRTRLPIHLALRRALECGSRADATQALRETGLAGCGHILVADAATGGVGLECTSRWVRELDMDAAGRVHHTNHLLLLDREVDGMDVEDSVWLADSRPRLARVKELTAGITVPDKGSQQQEEEEEEAAPRPSMESLFDVLKDEQGYPASINRRQNLPRVKTETLFTIIMDLAARRAQVTFGRPTEFGEKTLLSF
ncbi:hypothetical protein PG993_004703 [Apiospora rasikravindrae]|uniref:Peptidase C45 hydrolase domain-containing protein n=1 Tax=Apiospora rasikravindrae TaxID=990691 RepID=A0ABR1TDH8_9PEZI